MTSRMSSGKFLEIACFSVESAIIAHKAGASRIELCAHPAVGGITPTLEDLEAVKAAVGKTPVHVMIRPRGGGFVYDKAELELMRSSIASMRPRADGFVFGILVRPNSVEVVQDHPKSKDVAIDVAQNTRLLQDVKQAVSPGEEAQDIQLNRTFHRAFDEVQDWRRGLRELSRCGFNAVLVSGHKDAKAIDWTGRLREMVQLTRDERLAVDIIIGGSVRSQNLGQLVQETDAAWYHSSALVDDSGIASFEEIKRMKSILDLL